MLNKLKKWLQIRKEQHQWEQSERDLAYRLLGQYKSIRVLVSNLSKEDKDNIIGLMSDQKYLSWVKMQDLLKSNWLQKLHLGKIHPEQGKMYEGGVQMLQLVEKAALDELRIQRQSENLDQQKENILDSLGW